MSAPLPPNALPARCEVVVVGGGIAGLAAAWRLRDRDVVLLEADRRLGGRIRSEPRGPYWLNLGAHVFPGPESDLGRLVTEVGLETAPIPGSAMGAYLNGRLVSTGPVQTYPLRLPMPARARLSLVRAGLTIRRAASEYRELARRRDGEGAGDVRRRLLAYRDDRAFADLLGPLHPDADALVRAAVNRVSAEPEELSAGAGAAQFAATFSGSASAFHRNLPGGSGRLVDALVDRLAGRIVRSAEVVAVERTAEGVRVSVELGGEIRQIAASAAVVAAPAPVARRIVRPLPPRTAAALDAIVYGPYVVAALLTCERDPMPWDGLYAVVAAKSPFNMLFNTVNVTRRPGQRAPGGSLMAYGAAGLGRRLLDRSDGEIAGLIESGLRAVFPQAENIVEEVLIQRWEIGIPYSTPGRHLHQAALEEHCGPIALAGDYIGERAGLDTAVTTGIEAADRVRPVLGPEAPRLPVRSETGASSRRGKVRQ